MKRPAGHFAGAMRVSFKPLPFIGVVRLSDLPIHVWLTGGRWKFASIAESPLFTALRDNDPEIYGAYLDAMQGLPSFAGEISWAQYLDLCRDIRLNGLRDVGPPIRVTDYRGQSDGHHRLAILAHLHGVDAQVLVHDGIIGFPVPEGEADRIAAIGDAALAFCNSAAAARDAAAAERDAAIAARDAALAERDAVRRSFVGRLAKRLSTLKAAITRTATPAANSTIARALEEIR